LRRVEGGVGEGREEMQGACRKYGGVVRGEGGDKEEREGCGE